MTKEQRILLRHSLRKRLSISRKSVFILRENDLKYVIEGFEQVLSMDSNIALRLTELIGWNHPEDDALTQVFWEWIASLNIVEDERGDEREEELQEDHTDEHIPPHAQLDLSEISETSSDRIDLKLNLFKYLYGDKHTWISPWIDRREGHALLTSHDPVRAVVERSMSTSVSRGRLRARDKDRPKLFRDHFDRRIPALIWLGQARIIREVIREIAPRPLPGASEEAVRYRFMGSVDQPQYLTESLIYIINDLSQYHVWLLSFWFTEDKWTKDSLERPRTERFRAYLIERAKERLIRDQRHRKDKLRVSGSYQSDATSAKRSEDLVMRQIALQNYESSQVDEAQRDDRNEELMTRVRGRIRYFCTLSKTSDLLILIDRMTFLDELTTKMVGSENFEWLELHLPWVRPDCRLTKPNALKAYTPPEVWSVCQKWRTEVHSKEKGYQAWYEPLGIITQNQLSLKNWNQIRYRTHKAFTKTLREVIRDHPEESETIKQLFPDLLSDTSKGDVS